MTMTATTTIQAPPSEVWAVLSDVRRWADWLPTVASVEPEAPAEPDRVGAAYRVSQPRLGTARWQVTDWRPAENFTWVSRRPGVTTTATHEVRPLDDGTGSTEVTLAISWSGPLAWLVRSAYGKLTQTYLQTEASALTQRVGLPR